MLHWHFIGLDVITTRLLLGTIFYCDLLLNFLAFINVKHLDLVFDIRNFLIS